ncbi:HEAT repeat domain-containing protein (plasmid) [Embleya sp. NBC_00888]|uniref:HEAT repeat domain-containing protein n=1 Tax=Embleya sp. NBC_00888 TaxID=2975960 RepID=UPI002F910604|nr:HEAT repeat domain-containing protein [Embleya sp. NBC_00888]
MINDLDGIAWSSMGHAYGPADDVPMWLRAMTSPDAEIRGRALDDFYGAAHHQGDVYPCTAASLPFLFDMADDPATPDRASIVALLLSIGRAAVDRGDTVYIAPDGTLSTATADSAALMRERADTFVAYATDPDVRVRGAAIEALGLFLDDTDRALTILQGRLPAENGIGERLLIVRTTADLALRLPLARTPVMAWLDTLADDTTADPDIRLASLVHRARCAPADIGAAIVPTTIDLLRELTPAPRPGPDDQGCQGRSGACACTTDANTPTAEDVPPQIAAVFADLERHNRVHAPTTTLLRTFHDVLDARVRERTTLLTEQLRSPDPATRHDAIRMTRDLIVHWRGDHRELVLLLANCLLPHDAYTAAAAAETLQALAPVAEPARETLAAYVTAQRTTHGPAAWAHPHPLLRRAHREAVMALARLGDVRAVPSLLTALDDDVDAWRAEQVAGHLRAVADELVPRLSRRLVDIDLARQRSAMSAGAVVHALAELGDPAAVDAITAFAGAAVRHERWNTAASAVDALASFGTAAAPALGVVRPLADAADVNVRAAATAALWALERDPADVVPRLEKLLDSERNHATIDVLGRIGPPARAVLPRLRAMSHDEHDWTRVHAAAALWDIAGETEADLVVHTLSAAWAKNDATSNLVLTCLDRMGSAAAPALPRVRAELALPRRSGRYANLADDEELQRMCRDVLARVAGVSNDPSRSVDTR